MQRNMNYDHTPKAGAPTRKPGRNRAMTPEEKADLDAFRSLQPLSLRAVARTLAKVIRPK
jgi:hypothetical protein